MQLVSVLISSIRSLFQQEQKDSWHVLQWGVHVGCSVVNQTLILTLFVLIADLPHFSSLVSVCVARSQKSRLKQ